MNDEDEIDHKQLMGKLIEHEGKFVKLSSDIHGINEKLDPIAAGVTSIAWGFKALVLAGVASGAIVGILSLLDHLRVNP